jgi:hypothetical protein
MAAADYDRAYRPYAAPPSSAADYDRPYRNEIVPYGDRRIDLVVKPPARSPPPPLPVTKSGGGGGGIGSAWCFSDPEVKRRRRVASYKAYSVEGKVKASFRRGFRWIKDKCTGFIHGWYGSLHFFSSTYMLTSSFFGLGLWGRSWCHRNPPPTVWNEFRPKTNTISSQASYFREDFLSCRSFLYFFLQVRMCCYNCNSLSSFIWSF